MKAGRSPVYAVRRQPTLVDYPGCLAGLFFVSGCNFHCGFCHNAELAVARPGLPWNRLESMCRRLRENWADAAVVTGGEPCLAPDLPELLAFLKSFGWRIKLDTNGSLPDRLASVLPLLDKVAMDIKCAPARYGALTGFSDMDAIVHSIGLLKSWTGETDFRITVIASFHHETDMEAIGRLLEGARRMVVQPFIPRDTLPDKRLRSEPRTPPEILRRLGAVLARHVPEVCTADGERIAPGES